MGSANGWHDRVLHSLTAGELWAPRNSSSVPFRQAAGFVDAGVGESTQARCSLIGGCGRDVTAQTESCMLSVSDSCGRDATGCLRRREDCTVPFALHGCVGPLRSTVCATK